ncbi:hypothetical protein DM01DRAFT_1340049 [Hesseltinella vesiculosa]|uniref:Kinase n=1 Tax=Hesseltinella vesiculosa TaxID=101127 RepID=A0A1X2G5H1_9FUNG|nr:hypothetical protein DM01DRAFT_1340049 [Hesseltinella vesiculosa]
MSTLHDCNENRSFEEAQQQPAFDPTSLTSSLPLLPFQNQVGGHCSFFRFSKRAICKPMSHKERQFYEHLDQHHAPLLPFISQYLGVVNVTYRSSNAQPMLPEVILADNPQLLLNWKRGEHRMRKQQPAMSSSSISDDELSARPALSPRSFKEQVLREVFSPEALLERLQQVKDWQQGMRQRQLEQYQGDTPPPPCLHPSRSVMDFRPTEHQQRTAPPSANPTPSQDFHSSQTQSNSSLPRRASGPPAQSFGTLVSSFTPQRLYSPESTQPSEHSHSLLPVEHDFSRPVDDQPSLSSPHVIVHPRQPSIIGTTTSAPQTPRMRETKLHNPSIRPLQASSTTSPSINAPPVTAFPSIGLPPSPSVAITSPPDTSITAPTQCSPLSSASSHEQEPLHSMGDRLAPATHNSTSTLNEDIGKEPPIASHQSSTSSGASWRPRRAPNNPWSEQMYRRDLEKVNVDDDLTDGIEYPCVLDLKMGTRQHSVYATETKFNSQTSKCTRSTSSTMGVRVSRMQVYNLKQGQFLFEDKYHGRTLKPETFRETLVRYFDNGQGCQTRHLPALIRKLTLIYRIIQSMDSYRFYASSLLIIYDAFPTSKRQIDVRLIDFAKSVSKQEWLDQQDQFTYPPEELHRCSIGSNSIGPDQGYLLGLRSLVSCFSWIYTSHGGNPDDLVKLSDDRL